MKRHPPLSSLHDVELAAFAAAGGRREFGELVRRYSPFVRALLRRMGAQHALADDIAQDAFMRAYEKCMDFRGQGSFGSWVGRIAARLYLRQIKYDARYADMELLDDADWQSLELDPIGRFDLDKALQVLSEHERLCVSLSHGAGLTHEEIGKSLNLPLGTVKSHVKRGLHKMREHLLQPQVSNGRLENVG